MSPNPPRTLITLRLDPATLDQLDRIATDTGSDRSRVLRWLIDAGLSLRFGTPA